MPGIVATIAAKTDQPVKLSKLLLTLESTRIGTAINAPRDAVVEKVFVDQTDPKHQAQSFTRAMPAAA